MSKIAVASNQGGLDDQVSAVFGRCQTFTLVEAEGSEIKGSEVVQNQYANERSGAGIQAAGFIANEGVEAVIAGNFGPNVTSVLNQSNINMAPASGMSVREAVQKYLKGDIKTVSRPTATAKSGGGRGMGRGVGRRAMSQQSQTPRGISSQRMEQLDKSQSMKGPKNSVEDIESRVRDIEDQIKEIRKSLSELKE